MPIVAVMSILTINTNIIVAKVYEKEVRRVLQGRGLVRGSYVKRPRPKVGLPSPPQRSLKKSLSVKAKVTDNKTCNSIYY